MKGLTAGILAGWMLILMGTSSHAQGLATDVRDSMAPISMSLQAGRIGEASTGLANIYDSTNPRRRPVAVSAQAKGAGDSATAALKGAALLAFRGEGGRGLRSRSVPPPRTGRIMVADGSLDNTAVGAAIGAGAGLATGGPAEAVVGGIAGAAAGAYSDIKEHMAQKDEQNEQRYRSGTDQWQKTHEDYLRRRAEKAESGQ